MEFVQILDLLISEYGSQTKLAAKIGVKQSQISEWLKGKAKPGYDTLKQMAVALDVKADFLLGLEDELGERLV